MDVLILFCCIFFPPLVCGAVFLKKYSPAMLLDGCAAALAAVLLVILVQAKVGTLVTPSKVTALFTSSRMFSALFFDGFIEEGIKLICFLIFLRLLAGKQGSTNLLLAVFFGFCFASFEAVFFLVKNPHGIPLRIVTAFFLHGSIARLYLRIYKTAGRAGKTGLIITVILLHASYNMFLAVGGFFSIFSAAAVLLCWVL